MIKCVAIDDEPIALTILQEYCRRYGDIELRCFTSPVKGMECIKAESPDIVFLDIEMNSHNGVELARELPAGVCLIFTTAFANYALDGFEVDAVDFLHKPIFYPRFERAIEKARKFIDSPALPCRNITLKVEHRNVVISCADIIVVEAMDNYVKVYRRDLPTVISQITMKEIEAMLPADGFVRVHRSFIVGILYVEKYCNRTISLRGYNNPVPVGRKYSAAVNIIENIIQSK